MIKERITENKTAFGLSFAGLIVFGFCSFYLFMKIYPQAFESNKLELSNLISQKNYYDIKDEKGSCLGFLSTKISSEEQNTELALDARLNINLNSQNSQMLIKNQNAFNPLQQLVASVTSISAGEYKLILGILNVNPIELSVSISHYEKNILKRKFSVPGPVLLKQQKDESGYPQLIIQYAPSGQSFPINFADQISDLIKVHFENSSSEKQQCPTEQTSSLNLEQVKLQLENRYKSLIPEFGFDALEIIKMLESQNQ